MSDLQLKLQQAFDRALNATVRTCSQDKFMTSFQNVDQLTPDTILSIHEQIMDFLESSVKEEFDSILTKREIISKLPEFSSYIQPIEKDSSVLPFIDPCPSQAFMSQIYETRLEELKDLQQQIQKVDSQNQQIRKSLRENEVAYQELTIRTKAKRDTWKETIDQMNIAPWI